MAKPNLYKRAVWGIGLLACVTAVAATGMRWRERRDEIAATTATATNYAAIVAEQVSDAVLAIDLSLREALVHQVDPRSPEAFRARAMSPAFRADLRAGLARLPQGDFMAVVDATGELLATTRDDRQRALDVADRDYFARLRDDPSGEVFVSAPLFDKIAGEWTVVFARGVRSPEGDFLGAILIGARPEELVQTSHSLAEIPGLTFVLARRDGTVFLRQPDPIARTGATIPAGSEWHDAVAAGGGTYRSPGVFDSETRHVAVRSLARYPLTVTVAIAERAALAAWTRRTRTIAIGGGLIVGALALLLMMLRRQILDLEESRESLQKREEQLAGAHARLETAIENMSQGLAMFDAQERLVVFNRTYAEIYGLRPEEIPPDATIDTIIELRRDKGVLANISEEACRALVDRQEFDRLIVRLADGRSIALSRRRMPATGGWVTTHEDVTKQLRQMEQVEFLALHDPLTGLANRAEFLERLKAALADCPAACPAAGPRPALLLADLDGFKEINDSLGHGAGDEVLRQLSARLTACAEGATVARIGGDEFAILDRREAGRCTEELAARLMNAVRAPFMVAGRELPLSISVGVAELENGRDIEQIMRWADLALYRAKRDGRNCWRRFDPQLETEFQERATLAEELRAAIESDAIEVHYQPIVDTERNRIVSMEALARWRHPTRGFVPPAVFVPLAEETGLIPALGAGVLRRACAEAAGWPADVALSVNCSPLQVAQGDFLATVRRALDESDLPAARLEVEITESVLLRRDEQNLQALHALRALGASIALDDFGTGYSSLAYLRLFPFDKLKIDRCFVSEMTSHSGSAAIVAATATLARSFDISTCAEGVETQDQADALRAAGLRLMQGYLFGRPQPGDAWRVVDGRIEAADLDNGATLAA
jgi:diguanylate cyclase (GGDEF)-like protein